MRYSRNPEEDLLVLRPATATPPSVFFVVSSLHHLFYHIEIMYPFLTVQVDGARFNKCLCRFNHILVIFGGKAIVELPVSGSI